MSPNSGAECTVAIGIRKTRQTFLIPFGRILQALRSRVFRLLSVDTSVRSIHILHYYNISYTIIFCCYYWSLLQIHKHVAATFLHKVDSCILLFIFRISKCLYLLCTLLFTLVLENLLSLSVVPVHFLSSPWDSEKRLFDSFVRLAHVKKSTMTLPSGFWTFWHKLCLN